MSADWLDQMEEDAAEAPSTDKLERVTQLCDLLARQDAKVEQLEKDLKDAKEAYNRTRMNDLPELMEELNLKSMELRDGSKVEVVKEVNASITKAKKPMALAWLSEHGFGGLIKTKVITEFAASERDEAVECSAMLSMEYDTVNLDETVHPATLKSFVKERMAEGDDIPVDLFGVHYYSVAKLKRNK